MDAASHNPLLETWREVEYYRRDGMSADESVRIAVDLWSHRVKHKIRHGCLRPYGAGVVVWILSRLRDQRNSQRWPQPSVDETRANRLFVLLHFWSWDEEKYGPWNDRDFQSKPDTTARSPVTRIAEIPAEPIDKTAWRMDRQNRRDA